jgi:hypothetical protein
VQRLAVAELCTVLREQTRELDVPLVVDEVHHLHKHRRRQRNPSVRIPQ